MKVGLKRGKPSVLPAEMDVQGDATIEVQGRGGKPSVMKLSVTTKLRHAGS